MGLGRLWLKWSVRVSEPSTPWDLKLLQDSTSSGLGLGLRFSGLGFGGLGFRVRGLEFRVFCLE